VNKGQQRRGERQEKFLELVGNFRRAALVG
jgi:hypothetical protein